MAMGKSYRVSGVVDRRNGYSLLIEQRGNSEGLLVYSNNSVARLSSDQLQEVKAGGGARRAPGAPHQHW